MTKKLIDKDEDILQASLAVKAIAHPLRLKILCVLEDREVSVQDIVTSLHDAAARVGSHVGRFVYSGYHDF